MTTNWDDRAKSASRIRSAVKQAIHELPSNNSSDYEDLADQINALKVLKDQGVITWDDLELLTVGLKSSYDCIQRCQLGLPLDVIKDSKYGINIIKPI
jgi:hypothetical protein